MNHKYTILIIEDEKHICNFIETSLSSHDYKMIKAFTGKEGLSIITSCCPDLILLDLGLPDMDGIDIINQVRGFSPVPIRHFGAAGENQNRPPPQPEQRRSGRQSPSRLSGG